MMNSIQDGVSDRGKKQRSESQKKKDLTQPYHLYAEQNVNQTSTGPITWGPIVDKGTQTRHASERDRIESKRYTTSN